MKSSIKDNSPAGAIVLAVMFAVPAVFATVAAVDHRREANQRLRVAYHTYATVTTIEHGDGGRHGWIRAHAIWTDSAGYPHEMAFQPDDPEHQTPGMRVEVIVDPGAASEAVLVSDVLQDSRFRLGLAIFVWCIVLALLLSGVLARGAAKTSAVEPPSVFTEGKRDIMGLEFIADDKSLIIHPSKKNMLLRAILCLPAVWISTYIHFGILFAPSTGWKFGGWSKFEHPPMLPWEQQSAADHITSILFIGLFCWPWGIAAVTWLILGIRDRRGPMIFDRSSDRVTNHGRELARLHTITAITLDAQGLTVEAATNKSPENVILFKRVTRGKSGRTRVARDISRAHGLAIASYLQVPFEDYSALEPLKSPRTQEMTTAGQGDRQLATQSFSSSTSTGWVPAASAPIALKVEDVHKQVLDVPQWLKKPGPRRVRRRWNAVLVSLLGWGAVIVPILTAVIWVGTDATSIRTTNGRLTGSARDPAGRECVAYRFMVDGHEYNQWTPWDEPVPAALMMSAQKRESTRVWYLPRDPNRSYLSCPTLMQLPARNWIITNIKLIPTAFLTIWIVLAMRRRGKRIARAIPLAKRGRMIQGMVFRRASSRRTPTSGSMTVDGFPIHWIWKIWQSPSDDPDAIRYEFILDGKKRFGYIHANLLGVFRSDGLVGVVCDPSDPDFHLPLPVVDRYLMVGGT